MTDTPQDQSNQRAGFVALIGEPNGVKSRLINRLFGA
jgi:GTPase Era involved in 16S rRNA processing